MDRGAQINLQNKVIYSSELNLYLLHYIKKPEIGDESEYWWDVKSNFQVFNLIAYTICFIICLISFQ